MFVSPRVEHRVTQHEQAAVHRPGERLSETELSSVIASRDDIVVKMADPHEPREDEAVEEEEEIDETVWLHQLHQRWHVALLTTD